jgi:hypothetical protein
VKINPRLERIVSLLDERGFLSVGELGQLCGVSEMTIRRDLEYLDSQKRIQRTYGGAVSLRAENAASTDSELSLLGQNPETLLLDKVDILIATSVNPYYDNLLMARAGLIDLPALLAGRISGDSTVAYAIAFSRAVEAAVEAEAPPRAHYLRALMAELERLANHLGDVGAICNDASFVLMHAQCGVLRERVLRAAHACFGHRLMMDCVRPGGVKVELAENGYAVLDSLIANIRQRFPALVKLTKMVRPGATTWS